eukprot:TRINITY_DN11067_c0_g2_i1.p2 TRINITY_DN11067_c0_g2~~TRINITY_DN11067_c0_g2_i1.p2  ORF type:complete len:304 (+),score=87.98 TRINITY_DN11067_c0_g2_i1:76-912(+)
MARGRDKHLQSVGPLLHPQPFPGQRSVHCRGRAPIPQSRPFAGELDPPEEGPSAKASSIAGYLGYLPGTGGAIGLNYQQVLKTAEHYKSTELAAAGSASQGARCIPGRLVDRWGNMKRRDMEAVSHAANLYLCSMDPAVPVAVTEGIGKHPDAAAVEQLPDSWRASNRAARVQVPFVPRKRPTAPARVVGYCGHRPGARDAGQLTFNKIEMRRDPRYATQPNYEELSSVVDKVQTVPRALLTAGGPRKAMPRPATAPSFFLTSPIGRRTYAKDFIPDD